MLFIISEMDDRKRCSSNVLIYNIPESAASSIQQKIDDDINRVMDILSPLGSFPKPKKVIRIGSYKPDSIRPLKIVCNNEDVAKEILRSNKNNSNRNNHFRPDLTRVQRDFNKSVLNDFRDRLSKGESDLTVKYKNNLAYITSKSTSRNNLPKN